MVLSFDSSQRNDLRQLWGFPILAMIRPQGWGFSILAMIRPRGGDFIYWQ